MPSPEPSLRIVVLAGGVGSRFWPASTPSRPKPLLTLGGSSRPLIAETVDRALTLVPPDRFAILAGERLVFPLLGALPGLGPERIWVEPRARGTAPALVWAAHRIHRADREAVMVSLHSDHVIRPESAFREMVPRAAALAVREDLLLTVAASPDRPEPGYGYIRTGEALAPESGLEGWRVGAFVEKPDVETARGYLARGYLWNSGIFILPVARFLEEVRMHAPEIGGHLALLDRGADSDFFEAVPTISVDEAVLERSGRVGAVRAGFQWDDVGNWEALARSRGLDAGGNFTAGDAHAVDSRNSIVWAEDGPVVLFGVDDLVVVRSGGVIMVTTRAKAPELKGLLARLPDRLRDPRMTSPFEEEAP